MSKQPLKRHKALIPLSHDHHHGLLLCWKIRMGFSKKIELNRIKRYVDWFYENHIKPHFELEEQHIFPILGNHDELVKKAIAQHKSLIKLFTDNEDVEESLKAIEKELSLHIRFEERFLFSEIQRVATEKQLASLYKSHKEKEFIENTSDEFWL
ncbi:hemerythrin domain-containing protein [Maribacter sp. 2308TA10-17]|uniref:hemerythrin domain-containing protein n=1 Tax=Maribacter sp. 2308TA10-17 TaxID=3386276 RepID=UPI0039BCF962